MSPKPQMMRLVNASDDVNVSEETLRRVEESLRIMDSNLTALEERGADVRDRHVTAKAR